MNADRLISRMRQLERILSEEPHPVRRAETPENPPKNPPKNPKDALGERTARIDRLLFPRGARAREGAPPQAFHPDAPRPAHAVPLTTSYLAITPDGSDPLWRISGQCASWDAETLSQAIDLARELIVRYTDLYYDPSQLPVTFYRRQRRISAFLDQAFSPLLKEHVRRTGATDEPDLFLNEPIFYFKKEARTRAYPKNKHGRIPLGFLRERFRLLLMHRTAA
jgi:hypothetical protein